MGNTSHVFASEHAVEQSAADIGSSYFRMAAARIATAFSRYAERRGQYQAIRHLRALDDWALKDIGIHRSEIVSAVVNGRHR